MKRKALLALGAASVVVLLLLVVVYATLIAPTYEPEGCTYSLDISDLRRAAKSLPGERPTEIRMERVTSGVFPRAVACPGSNWEDVSFEVVAYQLVFPDRTILIDAAMDRSQAEALGMAEDYDPAAWDRVHGALIRADAVYVTHEHSDHMGGAVLDERVAAHVSLTSEQLDSDVASRPEIDDTLRAVIKPLRYEGTHTVAPGVVLIAARGHTPGSQMVYVQRADGHEVIFTGDTAWLTVSIEEEQPPAKLAGLMMSSDLEAQACQLRALRELAEEEPGISIVPGHDGAKMAELVALGVLESGFVP